MSKSAFSRETKRVGALRRYDVLDTPSEASFDRITRLASGYFDVPIALVSLIDEHRQWFKSRQGLDVSATPREIAFCAHAIQQDDVMIVSDALADPRFAENPLVTENPNIRFYAGAPLRTHDGYNLGTLCVIDREPRDLTEQQQAVLKDLASLVVDELELRLYGLQAFEELEENQREQVELKRLAWIDPLTGVYNRRYLAEVSEKEFNRSRRYTRPISFMMIDIDKFKLINDQYGHAGGDSVLIAFAELARKLLREQDCFGRFGGEEFLVILPETTSDEAARVAERIRAEASGSTFQAGDSGVAITVSIGISTIDDRDADLAACLKRADQALYQAKAAGRNTVISSDSPAEQQQQPIQAIPAA